MKKLVSRFMAVLMAMTMILSMSMTAFAAEAPKGTLTVNNTVAGKTLDLYQIFTATKSGDSSYSLKVKVIACTVKEFNIIKHHFSMKKW